MQPLAGLVVLDLSRLLPGPYATRVLADLGARVIKIESPEGDPTRRTPPFVAGESAAFAALNYGKESVVIDLKKPTGKEQLLTLAARATIVVESFRPGVLDKLGVGYQDLQAVNPQIILCSITGYGQSGPLRDVAGHDLNYQARAGLLALQGPADQTPANPAVQVGDLYGGAMHAVVGILSALLEGRGRHLDISMTRGALSMLAMELPRQAASAAESRGAGMLTGGLPNYRVYRTRDNKFMALGALEPRFFKAFCERAGCEEIVDLDQLFAQRTQDEWVTLLEGSDSCCEPCVTPLQAACDPALGVTTVQLGEVLALRTDVGVRPSGDVSTRVPKLGEDTDKVLSGS